MAAPPRTTWRIVRAITLTLLAVAAGHYAARQASAWMHDGLPDDSNDQAGRVFAPFGYRPAGFGSPERAALRPPSRLGTETIAQGLAVAPAETVAAAAAATAKLYGSLTPSAADADNVAAPPIAGGGGSAPPSPSKAAVEGRPSEEAAAAPTARPHVPARPAVSKRAEGDSTVTLFFEDPRKYRICSFTDICLNSTDAVLLAASDETYTRLSQAFASCSGSSERSELCLCFTKATTPSVMRVKGPGDLDSVHGAREPGHSWLIDKYVTGHQFGHWSESLVFFHSLMLQYQDYDLPPVERLILQKSDEPMTEHEAFIYKLAVSGLSPAPAPPLFRGHLDDAVRHGMRCFEQVSTTSITAKVANDQDEAAVFRARAYAALNLTEAKCPPPRAVLLYRTELRARRIRNEAAIVDLLHRLGVQDVVLSTINEDNSTAQQAELFANAGLLISSHSSQLVNMLFSQRGAAIIEVVPAFFNSDFMQLGVNMDLYYQFALGGQADDVVPPSLVTNCHDFFNQACRGAEAKCLQRKIWDREKECTLTAEYDSYARNVKHRDFTADIKSVEAAIISAIRHLNLLCDGTWPGITQQR